jgi:hypothetical protein
MEGGRETNVHMMQMIKTKEVGKREEEKRYEREIDTNFTILIFLLFIKITIP